MKKIYSLNKDWKFKKTLELKSVEIEDYFNMFGSDAKTGVRSDYLGDSWSDVDLEIVQLPHDWAIWCDPEPVGKKSSSGGGSQGFYPVGEVIYRKAFTLPDEMKNKRIFLKFDAIAIKSKIYINGVMVMREECGYTPVFVEITDFIEEGKQIVVAVVADSRIKEGWWYEGGGIYGNAYLIAAEKTMFADEGIFVNPRFIEQNKWEVEITAELDGDYQNKRAVYELDGNMAECFFSSEKQTVKMSVKNPKLWSCDEPNLYKLSAKLYDNDNLIDAEEITVGFRHITFDVQNGCLLNGKPIKIKGVCLHHDHAGVGVAVGYELHKYRLLKLREMGANAIRTSHNPQLKEFYRACNELGFLVMNETRHFSATEECLSQLRKFVRRDRNHPSVVMWSMFNEEPLQCTKIGYKMAKTMREVILSEDNTRPITGGMNGPLEPEGVGGCIDIMGFNYLQYGYEAFHKLKPDMPIVGSENCSYLTSRYMPHTDMSKDERCSFENVLAVNRHPWSATPGETWKNIEDKSYCMGGFSWTGIDYRGEVSTFPMTNCSFGAMDLCCFPKESFYMHKAVWDEKPFVHAVYYRDYEKSGDILINCYSNCEKIRVYIANELFGEFDCSKYELLKVYSDRFDTSEFDVIGINNGEEVSFYHEEMPTMPYHLDIELSKDKLFSDGEDICVVNVYMKGANGALVRTADNLINFSVSGGGDNVGVGNGKSTDLSPNKAKSRKLYAGCCQMIVQSNGLNENTLIRANSEGLASATAEIKTVAKAPREFIPSETARISTMTWHSSDVHNEYPQEDNLANFKYCWIPTTIGYGKNILLSGEYGFGAIAGRTVVPQNIKNKKISLYFESIVGDFDIYFNKELIDTYNGEIKNIKIPIDMLKYKDNFVITVVFRLNGEDCGVFGGCYTLLE